MSSGTSSLLSGSVTNPTLSSTANAAIKQAALGATGGATGTTKGTNALSQLSNNYNSFLTLLTTQLKNQDPTSPMDSNTFTTELVQFSSVEQQINTNTSLTQLIQLTQNTGVIQSSSMVGHKVALNTTTLPLQNGTAELQFTATGAQPATISIYDSKGINVGTSTVQSVAGTNTWNWNGTDGNGNTLPDGSYTAAVNSTDASGKSTALPFKVIGTATGVQKTGTTLSLQVGSLTTDFANVTSVLN
jgi:flagellar basal-body rod modification protein FlgD